MSVSDEELQALIAGLGGTTTVAVQDPPAPSCAVCGYPLDPASTAAGRHQTCHVVESPVTAAAIHAAVNQPPALPARPTAYRVLVTASRTWDNEAAIFQRLDALHAVHGDRLVVVHGHCPKGGDAIADRWCQLRGVPAERHPADWNRHGNAAGPIRNQAMVDTRPDECVAFIRNGSSGATGCSNAARRARIRTDFVDYDEALPIAVAATDDAVAAGPSAPWGPGEREQLLAAPTQTAPVPVSATPSAQTPEPVPGRTTQRPDYARLIDDAFTTPPANVSVQHTREESDGTQDDGGLRRAGLQGADGSEAGTGLPGLVDSDQGGTGGASAGDQDGCAGVPFGEMPQRLGGSAAGWHIAPARPAGPPPSTVKELRPVLIAYDASRPRSMQVRLGPSELGTPCQQQIARKLAGAPRQPVTAPTWAPFQGTAVHAEMEHVVAFWNAQLGRTRWLAEDDLQIDAEIRGHGDAYDLDWDTVVDWKHVGTTALKKLRQARRAGKPPAEQVSAEYRVQAHLYGVGHEKKGRPVRHVRLVLLARSWQYDDSDEWTEEYKPEIAFEALTRYYATQDLLNALNVQQNPDFITLVPAAPAPEACKWCPFHNPTRPSGWRSCQGDTSVQDNAAARALEGLIAA